MSAGRTIVFAGGGTGGHLFPSLAIVEHLALRRGESAPDVHFLCSDRPIDERILAKAGVPFTSLAIHGLPGSIVGKLGFATKMLRATGHARSVLQRVDAGLVVTMGGFVSAPAARAARKLGLPVMLVNLDAVAGKANRWLAGRADRVLSVYAQPGLPGQFETIDFPLRECVVGRTEPNEARAALDLRSDQPTLLVTGASQGAQTVNQAMEALARREALSDWQVLHLAGEGNVDSVERAFQEQGVRGRVLPFLEQMHLAWSAADLAISRAGAGSVAEVTINAVPTVFMPYPFHRDKHQRRNVEPLEREGAAIIVDDQADPRLNADHLEPVLASLRADEAARRSMREKLVAQPVDNGAAYLAGVARTLLGQHGRPAGDTEESAPL